MKCHGTEVKVIDDLINEEHDHEFNSIQPNVIQFKLKLLFSLNTSFIVNHLLGFCIRTKKKYRCEFYLSESCLLAKDTTINCGTIKVSHQPELMIAAKAYTVNQISQDWMWVLILPNYNCRSFSHVLIQTVNKKIYLSDFLEYPQTPTTFSSVQFSHSVVSDSLWPHES